MSERKAINKYYPPNFNPLEAEEAARKLSKKLKTMNRDVITIRLMTPFSMRCLKCSEFIPKSRKFNGKKELLAERYLDTIKQYRLSIKCPRCNNMISFRTDPKSGDYVMETGGVKNFVSEDANNDGSKTETLDETLQRLEKQQHDENKKISKGDQGDKLEQIEKRLSKMQQEQEDYEQLEALRKDNLSKMRKAEQLRKEEQQASREKALRDEKSAEKAFLQFRDQEIPGTAQANPGPISMSPVIPQKIRLKKKLKTNALGVVVKKKS